MIHGARQYIGDRFNAAVRVPREPGEVIVGTFVAEIVKKKERVEFAGFTEAEATVQLHAGALHMRSSFDDASNRSY